MDSDPNRITALSEATAVSFHESNLDLLGGTVLSKAVQRVEGGLSFVRPPTLDEAKNDLGVMFSVLGSLGKYKSALNYMLGDYLIQVRLTLGDEKAEEIIEQVISERSLDRDTIQQIERVCEVFKDKQKRLPVYTAAQKLLPLVKHCSDEEFQQQVEWARDGEAVKVDGEVRAQECKTCSVIQDRVKEIIAEKTGKEYAPSVTATVKDPTSDSEGYKLARSVCEAVQEMILASADQQMLNDAFDNQVAPAYRAWEQYTNKKRGRN